jgi:hypothetical protein
MFLPRSYAISRMNKQQLVGTNVIEYPIAIAPLDLINVAENNAAVTASDFLLLSPSADILTIGALRVRAFHAPKQRVNK